MTALYRASVDVIVRRPGPLVLAVNNRRWGGFSCPGGKVEEGEPFEAAARRELLEETGCEAAWLRRIAAMAHADAPRDGGLPWFCMAFEAGIGDQVPRSNEPGTNPWWTTPRDLAERSMYPGWYGWLFPVLWALDARGASDVR